MRIRRDPSLRFAFGALALAGLIVGGVAALAAARAEPSGPPCAGANGVPGRLVECLGPAIAHIETGAGFGSGVVLDDGYVITNAHVVDPFGRVKVSVGGAEAVEGVPVVGVDPLEDLAVVGPVEGASVGAIVREDTPALGDSVFLVGFPADFSEHPTPTISEGIVSRVQDNDLYELTYIETDAAIAHGQSGGALVDANGRLVGISGLGIEGFALSISGHDVRHAFDEIIAGDSPRYRAFPAKGDVVDGDLTLESNEDEAVLALPAAPDARKLRMNLDGDDDAVMFAITLGSEVFDFGDEVANSLDSTSSGLWTADIPPDTDVLLYIGTFGDGRSEVSFESNLRVAVLEDSHPAPRKMSVGDTRRGVIDSFEVADEFEIELAAGEQVDIYAGAPAADIAFSIRGRGSPEPLQVDDSGVGLLGFDAHRVYTAKVSGTYTISVEVRSPFIAGYVLRVMKVRS